MRARRPACSLDESWPSRLSAREETPIKDARILPRQPPAPLGSNAALLTACPGGGTMSNYESNRAGGGLM